MVTQITTQITKDPCVDMDGVSGRVFKFVVNLDIFIVTLNSLSGLMGESPLKRISSGLK